MQSDMKSFYSKAIDTLQIRDAGTNDLEDLLKLNQANLPHVGSISLNEMEHLYKEANYFRLAQLNAKAAGFLIAFDPGADYNSLNFQWFRAHYPEFLYIDRIVVTPDIRRSGVATSLYNDVEIFARKHNIPMLACEYNLRPKNEVSRSFHLSYGFEECGTQETEEGKKTVSLQIKRV